MTQLFAGGRPSAATAEDAAYLDFVEGARYFISTKFGPVAQRQVRDALDRAFADPAGAPADYASIRDLIRSVPVTPTNHRISRSVQEMIWRATSETIHKREAELLAELDRYDTRGPGSVSYDPALPFPAYATDVEFHLQTDGYAGTPLAGYIYHLGGNVFHSGLNDRMEGNRAIVGNVPVPADGQVRRVLELACSVGLSSIPLKERFPDAEIWATDASAPMVRYAHKRAVDVGLEIHFKQMLAEQLTFPDNSFDLVFVHILFHELPTEVAKQVVREAYRVLRPGGVFAVSDIKDATHNRPGADQAYAEYTHHWQVAYQGERYHVQFWRHDLAGAMRDAGFRDVNGAYAANDGAWQPNLAMPMRVGIK